MKTAQRLLLMSKKGYGNKIRSTAPANLIGYWPLWEASGTTATNYGLGGSARNGSITGGTLGNDGIGDGRTSWTADGSGDVVNVYSAGLAADFNGAEGTLLVHAKVAAAGVWTDGVLRYIVRLSADGNNYIRIFKNTTNNQLQFQYSAGSVLESCSVTSSSVGWLALVMTWSKTAETVKYYIGGVAQIDSTTLGVWAGSLDATLTVVGAISTTPANIWDGSLAHVAVWNTALTPAQVTSISRV